MGVPSVPSREDVEHAIGGRPRPQGWTLGEYTMWFAKMKGALTFVQRDLKFAADCEERGNWDAALGYAKAAKRAVDEALTEVNAAIAKRDAALDEERV